MSFYASTGQPQDPAGQQPHPGHQSRPSQLPPPAIPHPSASPVGKGSSSSTTTGANSQQQQQTPATFKGLHQLTGAPTPPVPLSTVTAFGSGGLSGTGGGVGEDGLADGVSAVGGGRGEREGGMSGGTAPGSSALGAGGEGGQHQQQQQVAGSAAGWGKNGSFGSSSVPEGVFEFTKRKKWANLLVNELSDTVVFVLVPSPQGGARIVYTSPGIRDLLGYSVKDVENRAIADLVYEPDLPPLLNYLQQSISNRTDLSSYHRFLPKRTPSAFLLSSPNPYAEGTSDSPTFLASTPNNDDDGQDGVGTGMTTPSDDGDANQEAGRRGSVESGYGGIGINQSDRKADAAGRPVLLELRGHGYWGEEADRAPIPLSLTTGSAAIPSGLPGGNTPSLSSGSASSSSASISPSVQLGSNANGNGSSSSGGDGQRCKCFFLMARRWPSRTGEMLDAFLEEKMENERLRAELMELMGPNGMAEEVNEGLDGKTDADYYLRQSTIPGLPSAFFSPTTSLLPPTSHAAGSQPPPLHHHSSSSSSSGAGGFVSQAGGSSFEYNRFHGGAEPSGGAYEDDNSVSASASASDDDDGDGAGYIPPASVQPVPATIATGWPRNKKAAAATDVAPGAGPSAGVSAASGSSTSKPAKKAKKSGTKDEGHVCTVCGRTDSPEWRKGPMGPKTLCNACGLRYAKKNAAASNALVKKKGASVVGTPAPGVGGGDR